LQKDIKQIEDANIRVVGVSYDSVAVLKRFSDQSQLTYPLLSDPDAKVITAYGLLNERASGRQKGIPHPATLVVGVDGKISAKLPGTVRTRHATNDLLEAVKKAK